METRRLIPYAAVLIVTAVGTWALAFKTEVRYSGEAGVKETLPARVGEWSGEGLYYCQNPECGKTLRGSEIGEDHRCPHCHGEISSGSLTEWALLPKDTDIRKMIYTNDRTGETLVVSLVLGGSSRTSIHRPQICLVGNGHEITRTEIIRVPLDGRPDLGVTLLDMLWRGRRADGAPFAPSSFYAYWFIGKGRETPSHGARMFWMAYDRIVRGVSHRWAYVGVSGGRRQGSSEYVRLAGSFIREFEPLVRIP
jgi:hypothetical protein